MSAIVSGNDVQGELRVDCDVLVIGSGAGGAVALHELAGSGLDVVCLEAGPHITPDQFTQRELDTVRRVYVDAGTQGTGDGFLSVLQGSCVGGSTVVNGEVCFRTPDYVLAEWAAAGVTGMAVDEMTPIFEEVERIIHVTDNAGRFLEVARKPADGLRKLGIEPRPIARNVKDCKGCSYCFFGCAYGCKQSMDQSYLPAALGRGARLWADARVERLELDGDKIVGATARTAHGSISVRARAVVLAAGPINTPLLLMDHRMGGDRVGTSLAVHPVLFTSAWYDEAKPERPATMLGTYTDAWVKDGFLVELGTGSMAFAASTIPGFGRAQKEGARRAGHVWGGGALLRDVDNRGRVVRKGGKKAIKYALTPQMQQTTRVAMRRLAEMHFAGGGRDVFFPTTPTLTLKTPDDLPLIDRQPLGPADIAFVSYHPQGTAAMGTVTDNDGAVKGVRNLYVMDTSVFPTPTGVNPQVSCMAVSTVLSRRLAARLRAA